MGASVMLELLIVTLPREKEPESAAMMMPRPELEGVTPLLPAYSTSGQSGGREERSDSAAAVKLPRREVGIFSKATAPLRELSGPDADWMYSR